MRNLLIFFAIAFSGLFIMAYFESMKDKYEEGWHMDYEIECENGFVYKKEHRRAIQIFNSDGTPLKCGNKIY